MIDSAGLRSATAPGPERSAEFGYAAAAAEGLPPVSIVTPFHDQASALADSAQSVFGQSLQNWEWLIVDAGSSQPEAREELTRLAALGPRVRVLEGVPGAGLAAARNAGTQHARGRLIAQVDPGDVLEPTAIEKWAWFLDSHSNLSFVSSYRSGSEPEPSRSASSIADWPPDLDDQLGISSGLVRADVYAAVGGYAEGSAPVWSAWEFRLRCAAAGYWGGTVPECLSRHPAETDRQLLDDLRTQYSDLTSGLAPVIQQATNWPADRLREDPPFSNGLAKNRPRLLLLCPWLTVGGADMFNLDLTRFALQLGWDVSVAATAGGKTDWAPEFASRTSDLFVLPNFLRPEDFPRFLRYLINSRQIDVAVVAHSEFAYNLLPYIRGHCAGVTFMDVCHIEMDAWRGGGYPLRAVAAQRQLDLNIVTTAHLKAWMVERGAEASRISVCHTNVDVEEWRPDSRARMIVRAELGLDASVPVVLYAARMTAQKQPMVLAQTVRKLRERGYPLVALVAGDGPDLPELEAFVTSQHLSSSVRLLGNVPIQALKRLMQAADIFFLPSAWEGISIAVYEAMACGMAVVTANVGGQSELVTSDCGVLVDPSSPESEAQAYAQIIGQLIDQPDLRAAMGAHARKRVAASFRLDQMAERLAEAVRLGQTLHEQQPRAAPSAAEMAMSALHAIDAATYEAGLLAVEAGRARLVGEATRWRLVAERQAETLSQMRAWAADLQRANTWLSEQSAAWESATQQQQVKLQELHTWVANLQGSTTWLSEQSDAWRGLAQEQAQKLQGLVVELSALEADNARLRHRRVLGLAGAYAAARRLAALIRQRLSKVDRGPAR